MSTKWIISFDFGLLQKITEGKIPTKFSKQLTKKIIPMVSNSPDEVQGNTIIKLKDERYKDMNLWRFRQDPMRLVYSLNYKTFTITFLEFEHRGKDYDMLDELVFPKDTPAYIISDDSLSKKISFKKTI